jgi:nitronate monooxygenase
MVFAPSDLEHPIVQAPLAGGPSTPALAGAVCEAGGLGFLGAGYKTVDAVAEDIAALRALTGRPFGVNVFAPPAPVADAAAVERYAAALGDDAGAPRHDDDGWEAKLDLLAHERVPVISFTFGCPTDVMVDGLRSKGCAVWVTVTTPAEARRAAAVGADALVVQGVEAGGHRGSFDDEAPGEIGLLALLQLVRAAVDRPLVATGGIVTGAGVAAVLAAGASAAALGTAFMLTPEAATSAAHRAALQDDRATALTRAFTGRLARGIANRFLREHPDAPHAYPDVHYVTAPIRAAARERGDAEAINLWAGQAHELATAEPAGDLVRRLSAEAEAALREAAARLPGSTSPPA